MSAPTAVRILPADAPRDAWLTARRAGIGASEIAAVLSISPWDSPFSLHWRKRQGWEVEANDEMRTGTLVEPVVADWWATECDRLGNLVVDHAGLYAAQDRPWQLATPDRLVYPVCPDCDGDGLLGDLHAGLDPCTCTPTGCGRLAAVLECKWTGSWDGWGEPDTDDIPVYYRTQVLWQCDVMDVQDWYLAVLGPGGFRAYHGHRDERDLVLMREAGRRFMDDLAADRAPDLDGHAATIATLRQLHPSIRDVDVDVPVALAEGYRRARALRRRAEKLVDGYESRIRAAIGDGRRAMCAGRLVASRSIYDQSGDGAELAALDGDWPTVDRLNPGRSATYA
jgi:putative phage-type endonuclease